MGLGESLKKYEENAIVVGHGFIGEQFNDKLSFPIKDIEECGAKYLCVGHDHNQYGVKIYGKTSVVRPGAVSRGTSTTENKVRVLAVAHISDEGVNYISIPSNKF